MLKQFLMEEFEKHPEALTMEALTKKAEEEPFFEWCMEVRVMRRSIRSECSERDLVSLMLSLQSMETLLLQNAIWSKKKDFVRGRKIMDVWVRSVSDV